MQIKNTLNTPLASRVGFKGQILVCFIGTYTYNKQEDTKTKSVLHDVRIQ